MVRAMKAGYNERGLPRVVATATDSHFVGAIVRIEWYCNKHFAPKISYKVPFSGAVSSNKFYKFGALQAKQAQGGCI